MREHNDGTIDILANFALMLISASHELQEQIRVLRELTEEGDEPKSTIGEFKFLSDDKI